MTGCYGTLKFSMLSAIDQKRIDWNTTPTRVPADLRLRRCQANLLTLRGCVRTAGLALPDVYYIDKGKCSPWIFAFGVHRFKQTVYPSADAMVEAMRPMVRPPRPLPPRKRPHWRAVAAG